MKAISPGLAFIAALALGGCPTSNDVSRDMAPADYFGTLEPFASVTMKYTASDANGSRVPK